MVVTQDKFELPLAVADSAYELADILHVDVTVIMHAVSDRYKKKPKESKYKKVWIDDSDM
jgi:hypothetical protein